MPETQSADEFLAHFGVKGMKWGVRQRYDDIRAIPSERIDLHTAKGKTVTLQEDQKGRIGAALGALLNKDAVQAAKDYRSFTVTADGKTVGGASFNRESKTELNMVWLGVNPKHRGQGYATSIFKAGVEYARKEGFSKITLEVPGNSPDARHIYEKFGFKDTGKVDGDEDDVWGGLSHMVYDIPKKGK